MSPLRRTISEPLPAVSPPGTGVTPYGHREMSGGSPLRSQENLDPEVSAFTYFNFNITCLVVEKMKENAVY